GKQEGEEDPAQGGRSHRSGGFGRGEAKNVAHPPAAWVRASADSPNRPKRKGPPAQRGRPLSSFAGGRSRSGAGGVVRGVGELLLAEAGEGDPPRVARGAGARRGWRFRGGGPVRGGPLAGLGGADGREARP